MAEPEPLEPESLDPASPGPERLWSVKDVATRLDVSTNTVLNLIKAGRLAANRIGVGRGVWRIPESSIHRYLAESVYRPPAPASRPPTPRGRPLRHIRLHPDNRR